MLFIAISEPCAITEEIFNILYKKSPNWHFESERYGLDLSFELSDMHDVNIYAKFKNAPSIVYDKPVAIKNCFFDTGGLDLFVPEFTMEGCKFTNSYMKIQAYKGRVKKIAFNNCSFRNDTSIQIRDFNQQIPKNIEDFDPEKFFNINKCDADRLYIDFYDENKKEFRRFSNAPYQHLLRKWDIVEKTKNPSWFECDYED